MNFIKNNRFALIGLVIGSMGGYLYYANIGCSSGSCAITSKPLNSTVYGAIMGALLLSMFDKKKNGKSESQN